MTDTNETHDRDEVVRQANRANNMLGDGRYSDQLRAELATYARLGRDGVPQTRSRRVARLAADRSLSMTAEQLQAVIRAALKLAAHAPARQAGSTFTATVPWDDVNELRSALESTGLDWRKLNREYRIRRGYGRP